MGVEKSVPFGRKALVFLRLVLTPGGQRILSGPPLTPHFYVSGPPHSAHKLFLRFYVSHLLGMWRNANCSPLASWHYIPECLVGFQLENVCLFERKLSSQHCRWGPASFIQVNAGGHFRFTLNDWKLFGCFPCSRSSHPSRCCERFSIVLCVVATPQPSN